MADLTILVPTRGRPARFAELVRAVADTATGSVEIVAGLDTDDPEWAVYNQLADDGWPIPVMLFAHDRELLAAKTNRLARRVLRWKPPHGPRYLAFLADDHRPRTRGWDQRLCAAIDALGEPGGWAYGDDLFQRAKLPTAWVVSRSVVEMLGWMMLPACAHLYVDNAVLALGQALHRIVYCPDVVIEHEHPFAGRPELWDDLYHESNTDARYAADKAAYLEWYHDGGLAADAEKLMGAVREAVNG
jgi:hypothetical protein